MSKSGRIIGVITGFLNRIICLALACLLLVLVVKPELLSSSGDKEISELLAEFIAKYELVLILVAAFLVVLNLNLIQFILYIFWNTELRRYISSSTASGKVRVSLDAVERALKVTAKTVQEITKCRLRVFRIGAKRYKVEVLLWIPEDCNVLNITEKLRLILKKRFSELITVEPDERVFFEISLAGIKGRNRAGSCSQAVSGPPRDAIDVSKRQFKGPIYPVDSEL